jgi:hypothetical protein
MVYIYYTLFQGKLKVFKCAVLRRCLTRSCNAKDSVVRNITKGGPYTATVRYEIHSNSDSLTHSLQSRPTNYPTVSEEISRPVLMMARRDDKTL